MSYKKLTAGKRIKAMFLDHIVIMFVMMLFVLLANIITLKGGVEDSTDSMPRENGYYLYLMVFVYSLYLNKDILMGKSVAKRALNQEVVNVKTGELASSLKCLVRNLTIVIFPIEVLVILVSPSRRIGDFIAGTRVDFISGERNIGAKFDLKNLIISVVLGFMIVFSSSLLFKGKSVFNLFANYDYIESSFNKNLSRQLEIHLDSTQNDYLKNTHIQVYDSITNDTLKYISASFSLNDNYIESSSFDDVKEEIFNSMFDIVPKSDFVLSATFKYNGKSSSQSTWSKYDWR